MFLCKIKFTTSNEKTPRSIHSHALRVHLPLGNLILGAKVGFFFRTNNTMDGFYHLPLQPKRRMK